MTSTTPSSVGAISMADAFAQCLYLCGCRRIYGLPGEDHVELLDAVSRHHIEYIVAYNESAAALMASADATESEGFGVVLVSMSAGMSNAMNGIAHAYMEQIPLLVISGQHDASKYPFIVRQGFDLEALARSVTKWQIRITAGTDVTQAFSKALAKAYELPRGPVYIEFPSEAAIAPAISVGQQWLAEVKHRPSVGARLLDDHEIESLKLALEVAVRPILILGGREHCLSTATLERFSNEFHVPVFVTTNQKGSMDPFADYFAGVFLNGNAERSIVNQADKILTINLEGFDIYSGKWPYEAEVISLNSKVINEMIIPTSTSFIGDPDAALMKLMGEYDHHGLSRWNCNEILNYREELKDNLWNLDEVPGELTTTHAVLALTSVIPEEASIVVDAGFSKPIVAHLWPTRSPRTFFASNALSTMGNALPMATAISLVNPDRPTIAFMGDGSLLMRVGEYQAALQTKAKPVAIAFLDRSLRQISLKQESKGRNHFGVDLPPVNASRIAEAFGGAGYDVYTETELKEACCQALQSDRATLIGVHVSSDNAKQLFDFLRG